MSAYKEIKNCVACGSSNLDRYLDLTDQPLANSYHKGIVLEKYPLGVQHCSNCTHSMLTVSVNPEKMFSHYLYVSDTSATLTKYFEDLCDTIVARNNSQAGLDVLEIACNSGLFLEMFAKKGMKCHGVDPAENLRQLSLNRNLDVDVAFWDESFANSLADKKTFDIVCAIHVLPHVPDPVAFLRACRTVLKPSGKVYIQTSQCNMFVNKEFDAIYHEHVSYFTAKSFGHIAHLLGFAVTGAWKAPIHSSSFVFELSFGNEDCADYLEMVRFEDENNYNSHETFHKFSSDVNKIKNDLVHVIQDFKNQNYKIVGYGASAKGNTLLNWTKMQLDYIVDDSNFKWDYLTPGMDVPIKSPAFLYQETTPVIILCLAWNFFDEIYANVKKNTNISHKFVTYFPSVTVKES